MRNANSHCVCSDLWCYGLVLLQWYSKPCVWFGNNQEVRQSARTSVYRELHIILSNILIKGTKSPKVKGELLRLTKVLMLKKHFSNALKTKHHIPFQLARV